jgi:hypothetical protein
MYSRSMNGSLAEGRREESVNVAGYWVQGEKTAYLMATTLASP